MIKELCCIIGLLALMCLVVQKSKTVRAENQKRYRCILIMTAFLYLCGVAYFTMLASGRSGVSGVRTKIDLIVLRSLIQGVYRRTTHLHVLNILMFIPFGYLLPHFVQIKTWKIVLLGLVFSLIIETSQLIFHVGFFQVDDLIDNTIGGVLGCFLYRLIDYERKT